MAGAYINLHLDRAELASGLCHVTDDRSYYINDMGKQIALLVLASREKPSLRFEDLLDLYVAISKRAAQEPRVEQEARHSFISTLQAKGIEVGLVAKLAGHANAAITLSHYTQAVRGGEAAMRALEEAYAGGDY